ncbi:MAG: prepilin-type N-terminal cleavage/methylation domain-containing protein [bacterium]
MRKQSGFTLIELMVVMAIIAILATAGLSAYGGYLKKARDSHRISDLKAIQNIILSIPLGINGSAPDLTTLKNTIISVNGVLIRDPLYNGTSQAACLDHTNTPNSELCEYEYFPCTDGGYILSIAFESASNTPRYAFGQDELKNGANNSIDLYDTGSCSTARI